MPMETVVVVAVVIAAFGIFAGALLRASHQTEVLLRAREAGARKTHQR